MPADAAPSFLYLPDLPAGDEAFALPPEEAHYVARVCRARAGEVLQATDGAGTRARLTLLEVGARTLARVDRRAHEAMGARVVLLCGAPETGRGDWMVEKLAELGVTHFQPIDAERGAWRAAEARRSRWERVAIAALRQSRRTRRMAIAEPRPLEDALAEPAGGERWLADPEGAPAADRRPDPRADAAGLVGPSAGLSPREKDAVRALGWSPIALAAARLRTETAAVAWAAWRESAVATSTAAPESS